MDGALPPIKSWVRSFSILEEKGLVQERALWCLGNCWNVEQGEVEDGLYAGENGGVAADLALDRKGKVLEVSRNESSIKEASGKMVWGGKKKGIEREPGGGGRRW